MNTDLDHHPAKELLANHIQGTLSTGVSVALSAHLELCDSCRASSRELEAEASDTWLQESGEVSANDFSKLIKDIVVLAQENPSESRQEEDFPISKIHMHDHSFDLPRVLAKAANDRLEWKRLAGGINQAVIDIDSETQCEFIYMSPGSKTPMHRHEGSEITLVLDGSFSDSSGTYGPADFIVREGEDEHQPVSEEGCLCFAVLDKPLTFTRGLARLFNPLNKYKFRKTTAHQV